MRETADPALSRPPSLLASVFRSFSAHAAIPVTMETRNRGGKTPDTGRGRGKAEVGAGRGQGAAGVSAVLGGPPPTEPKPAGRGKGVGAVKA